VTRYNTPQEAIRCIGDAARQFLLKASALVSDQRAGSWLQQQALSVSVPDTSVLILTGMSPHTPNGYHRLGCLWRIIQTAGMGDVDKCHPETVERAMDCLLQGKGEGDLGAGVVTDLETWALGRMVTPGSSS